MKRMVLIIAVCAAVGAAVWLGLRSRSVRMDQTAPNTTRAALQPSESLTPESASRTPRIFKHRERSGADVTASNAPEVWDGQIDAILESPNTDAEIADKLLEVYPRVPAEGQADLALQIASRVSNEDYGKLSSFMTNSATPEAVLETLLTDLLDRPDKIRLPLLLDMARSKENPKAEDARDMLEALLGEDFGSNWDQWSKKISEWLVSHPE